VLSFPNWHIFVRREDTPWSDDGSVPFDLRVIADGTERILQKVRPNSASVNKKPNPALRANT
jgi:hypothetical protein